MAEYTCLDPGLGQKLTTTYLKSQFALFLTYVSIQLCISRINDFFPDFPFSLSY